MKTYTIIGGVNGCGKSSLTAYRAKPEMQKAVDTLLGVVEEPPAIATI